jgi:putative ubiquitin-RnfH superfamily antitoxin RatB of RatAB toxin-antitoxin module
MSEKISVEVAYALPEKQRIIKLQVPQGTTVLEAVMQSSMETLFGELTLGS